MIEVISNEDISKIIDYIETNELDYKISNTGVIRFHIIAYDKIRFYFYKNGEEYVIAKYDPSKDIEGNPGSVAYTYYNFKTLTQVLEQISFYDNSIPKNYWVPTMNSAEIGFDSVNYNKDWYKDYINPEDDCYSTEDCNICDIIVYSNDKYKPELKSPFNTLHEVSPINDITYNKVDKLYFEIHPISCLKGSESFLFKLLMNNEQVMKEYINYIITSKKGLKLFIDGLFKELDRFKNG